MDFAEVGGKVLIKTTLNFFCPGLGCVPDIIEAGHDVYNGDYVSAAINLGSVVLDFWMLGLYSAAKETAKESAKKASVKMAKQTCKASTKKIGEETAKKIAEGAPKKVAVEFSKLLADRAKKETGSKLSQELATGLLNDLTEEAFMQSFTDVAFKAATLSFVESGGKNLQNALLEGAIEGIINNCSGAASPKLLTYSFGSTAKSAANSVANSYYEAAFKTDLVIKAGKAIANRCNSERES